MFEPSTIITCIIIITRFIFFVNGFKLFFLWGFQLSSTRHRLTVDDDDDQQYGQEHSSSMELWETLRFWRFCLRCRGSIQTNRARMCGAWEHRECLMRRDMWARLRLQSWYKSWCDGRWRAILGCRSPWGITWRTRTHCTVGVDRDGTTWWMTLCGQWKEMFWLLGLMTRSGWQKSVVIITCCSKSWCTAIDRKLRKTLWCAIDEGSCVWQVKAGHVAPSARKLG